MSTLKHWTIGFAALALTAAGAFAGDWHRCGQYSTGGGAKEVPANYQNVRTVQLHCLEGGVNIQTLWVRNGGQKEEHRVARSLQRGEKYNIELGGRDTTGFRISDSGNGRYEVLILTDGHRKDDRHHHHGDRHDDWYDRYDRRHDDRYYDDRYYDDRYDRRPPPPPRRERNDAPSWWPW